MKNIIRVFIFFVPLFIFAVILQSCSSENSITSASPPPPINNSSTTTMAKTTTLTTSTSPDTTVYLPLSKKTIRVSKSMSAEKIAMVDKYFSTHKSIGVKTNSVSPMLRDCTTHIDYGGELEMQFQAVAGKSLGISNDWSIISDSDAKNIYGFSLCAAFGFDNIASVHNAGYDYPNIMVEYLNPTSALSVLQYNPNQYPKCGYYEIDEPTKYSYSPTDTKSLETLINNWNTGAKVMLSDFHWPGKTLCTAYEDWGAKMEGYCGDNYYITCDNYGLGTETCGKPCEYWDEYTNYYGSWHVVSNYVYNQSVQSSNWDCCFKLANGTDQNIKQIWLWAGTGDLAALQTFCMYAWYNGWLLRQEKETEIIWKCNSYNPCTTCVWPSGGSWYVEEILYTGRVSYVPY